MSGSMCAVGRFHPSCSHYAVVVIESVKWFGFRHADPRCRESFHPYEPSHLDITVALCIILHANRERERHPHTDAHAQMHPPTHPHTHTCSRSQAHSHHNYFDSSEYIFTSYLAFAASPIAQGRGVSDDGTARAD
jgi:hypothetical protein